MAALPEGALFGSPPPGRAANMGRPLSRSLVSNPDLAAPGPCLQVENEPPLDLHSFGACRFHRSMGPAVGLVQMVDGRGPRRQTPPVPGSEDHGAKKTGTESLHDQTWSSTGDLRVFLRRAEIGDDGLAVASLLGGFIQPRRKLSGVAVQAPVAPGNASSVKKRMELFRSPRCSPSTSREASLILAGEEEIESPQQQVSSFLVQPWPQGLALDRCEQMLLETPPLAGKGSGSFQGLRPSPSPEHWQRSQKRPVKLGSAYTSRMRAILRM